MLQHGGARVEKSGRLHDYWKRRVGSCWTIPVLLSLAELRGFQPVIHTRARLQSIRSAVRSGIALPPIELGVFDNSTAWLIDGNHRLTEARESGRPSILARLTFVGR
jgi:hypothetical protein